MTIAFPFAPTQPFASQSFLTRVVMRAGASLDVRQELAQLGRARPLVLSTPGMATRAGYANIIQSLDGIAYRQCNQIPEHTDESVALQIVAQAREHQADAIVAIGGGSTSDTAKGVAMLLAEGGAFADHASRFEPPRTVHTPRLNQPKIPIITIPFTASGAEVTGSFGIRGADGYKMLFSDPQVASRVVLLDPALNVSVPASIMLSTAMNGLAHCVEGLYSSARSPISSALALHTLPLFARAMRAIRAEPVEQAHRADLLTAGVMSGMVLASARSCLHHAICHVIGAKYGVSHGNANSAILPHAVRFNLPAAVGPLSLMGQSLGLTGTSEEDRALAAVQWIEQLQRDLGVPRSLKALGVPHDHLESIAAHVMHERGLAFNPRTVHDAAELLGILRAAWDPD